MGGYVGAFMARAGEDVTLIDMWPENVAAILRNGLQLSGISPQDNFSIPMRALHVCDVQSTAKSRPFDVAFVCVKAYDTEWASRLIEPYLTSSGYLVSLQNCINEERIAGVVGWGKVLGAVAVHLGTDLYEPGRIKRTIHAGGDAHTVYRAGELHGAGTPRAEQVAHLLRYSDSAKVTENIWGERWSKLTLDAGILGLASVTGLRGTQDGYDDTIRWVRVRLAAETIRVGQALGYHLIPMHGLEPETIARAGEGDREALAAYTARLAEDSKRRSSGNVPSSAQDILKGRRTETDFVNGYVAAKGREIGVPAPLNAKMYELVKRVERRELAPVLENVKGL